MFPLSSVRVRYSSPSSATSRRQLFTPRKNGSGSPLKSSVSAGLSKPHPPLAPTPPQGVVQVHMYMYILRVDHVLPPSLPPSLPLSLTISSELTIRVEVSSDMHVHVFLLKTQEGFNRPTCTIILGELVISCRKFELILVKIEF